jgi:sulfur-oxidizing protein SoxX
MIKKSIKLAGLVGSLALATSLGAQAQALSPQVQAALDSSFKSQGIADKSRMVPDEVQLLCSDQAYFESPEGQKKAIALQDAALKAIKPPSDGNYMGDWKAGEKVAQSGRGLTWKDSLDKPNGGSCYNCHQVTDAEISYGTIGPSLLGYGKLRGNSKEIVEYTWNRINNSKAYNLCSNMPRMAHFNILTEQQMKDVMALLLDPASPVNQ